jgi:magnesium chelatase family protein
MERGKLTLTRAHGALEMPAQFTLAANGNLCPCGGWPPHLPLPAETSGRAPRCRCRVQSRLHYLSKLSGPILDRIDLIVTLGPQKQPKKKSIPSIYDGVRNQVEKSRATAIHRYGAPPGLLSASQLEALLGENPDWNSSLDEFLQSQAQSISLRGRHKLLRIALSLSCWDETPEPLPTHWIEASFYRAEHLDLCG